MASDSCLQRNAVLIPKLLGDHGAQLHGAAEVYDLSTAENQLLMEKLAARAVGSFSELKAQTFSYSPGVGGSPGARQRIADLLSSQFQPQAEVKLEHIVLGAGGSFALNALVEQICEPTDAILIAAPYWPGLDLSISVAYGATVVPVHVPLESFFSTESIVHYEEALSRSKAPVKAVLICNPHNPLGCNYPKSTLQAILSFCTRHKLHFISDEVYALSQHVSRSSNSATSTDVEGSGPFVSALQLDPGQDGAGLVHVLYSLSKDFGCNGLRIGAFISQSNKHVCMSGALSTFCQTSAVAALIAEKAVLHPDNIAFINGQGREMLTDAYTVLREFLAIRHIEFVPAVSGMFVFARLCPTEAAEDEVRFRLLLKKNAVVLAAGTDYHFQRPGWFRICYAVQRQRLEEALRRIAVCLDQM
ncbi:aminotransferase GliI [Microdochium bolleyi]|uniref:Aminotransferase GliI n=1 Tax=Microdochium bolleyi TaxID=196109 RepID=A0A136IJ84_9PEZI|nr:aminotransferase GliI [Microdochium bolleyi]